MGQFSGRLQTASDRFAPNPGAVVVSADMTRILSPGDDEIGWLARRGLIPLGYLGDPDKTARTFPVAEGGSGIRFRGIGRAGTPTAGSSCWTGTR
jgi:3-oxocholest-4-en-26-oate---CoA ligase